MHKTIFTHPADIYKAWLNQYQDDNEVISTNKSNTEILLIIYCQTDTAATDITKTLDSINILSSRLHCIMLALQPIANHPIPTDYQIHTKSFQYIFCEPNGSTIESLLGDTHYPWALFVAAGTMISKHALAHLHSAFQENQKACVVYGDEDFIDSCGHRTSPHFRPDFNYHLLLEQSIGSELLAIRSEHLLRYQIRTTPMRRYIKNTILDVLLRTFETFGRTSIAHTPHILSHHSLPGEEVESIFPTNAESNERISVIEEHLKRTGQDANIENGIIPSFTRICHPVPREQPLVSIVIPTRDKADLLRQCIRSIFQLSTYNNYEVIVVDNQSTEKQTESLYEEYSGKIKIVTADFPFNFSKLVNLGVQASHGEYVILLNNDIEVMSPNWIEELVSLAALPDVGAVGAKLLFPDGKSQHSGVITGIGGVAGHSHKGMKGDSFGYFGRAQSVQEFSAVTGACLAISRKCWDSVRGFDEQLAVAFNDVDFCLRVRKSGFCNLWTPYATLIHHESASRGYEDNPDKHARFIKEWSFMRVRWDETLDFDPSYNPNLTAIFQDFSLSWPPRHKLQRPT